LVSSLGFSAQGDVIAETNGSPLDFLKPRNEESFRALT